MRCGSRSSRLSPNDAACSSRAPSVARRHPGPGRPPRPEPEDGGEVAGADRHRRRADGPAPAPQHRAERGRGGDRRRVPPPHPVAARRCPGLPARGHPGAQPQRAPPLPGAARHLPPAARSGEGLQARALRRDRGRPRPHRRLRAALGRRQAPHVPGHRPRDQVRPRRLLRRQHQGERRRGPSASEAVPRTLREVVEAFPYAIHTVLTDNGMAFADLPKYRDGPTAKWMGHIFDRVCRENGIEHRLTKPYHPWTNGQAERMNRTVKDATIKAFHYPGLEALKAHVLAFVRAYNFAKHLKALRWRTPFQAICDAWTKDRSIFKIDPHHLIPGPHT